MTKLQREIGKNWLNTIDRLPVLDWDSYVALRRAAIALHTWYEHECNGAIQRDGDACEGAPYWYNTNTGKRLYKARDMERGATKRIASICQRLGLHYYLQTDPRGGTLYVSDSPIDCQTYNRATFIA